MENGLEDVSCGLRWKDEVPVGTSVVWFICVLIGSWPNSPIALSPASFSAYGMMLNILVVYRLCFSI